MPKLLLFLVLVCLGWPAHASLDNAGLLENQIQSSIQKQIQKIPKANPYEENVLDSFAITQHLKGIGYKVSFHLANRDEYQAFFDEQGNWLSLNHFFDSFVQIHNQIYLLETTASVPKLHIFHKNKLKKTLALPARMLMRTIPEMVSHPEFGDNYGFSEEFSNKFEQISKNFLPIYYQPSKDLSTLKVLLIDTGKNEFLNFDLPISEVIPLKNKRYLIYQRYETEGTFFLVYFYTVDTHLNVVDNLDEINVYLKLHPDGFESFKYYINQDEVTLSFIPQSESRKQPQEKTFVVK